MLPKPQEWGEFVRAFNGIARHRHRYEVFRDFVTLSAKTVQNSMRDFMPTERYQAFENEYLATVKRYEKEETIEFSRLFAVLVCLLQAEPRDILGQLYMELELGNQNTGQFFTPPEVSELMARVTYGDELKAITKPFITLCEPACGAGGMILAFAKVMLSQGHNPAQRLWVHATDIDRTAALMCYLQLSLWHIPGVVVVGNSLTLEAGEAFYTPAHYLGQWSRRLNQQDDKLTPADAGASSAAVVSAGSTVSAGANAQTVERPKPTAPASTNAIGAQFDFGF
jgi:hypothetical protein